MPRHPTSYEPPWGADGWPRPVNADLDEGDRLLIQAMLRLTPRQRLASLRNQAALAGAEGRVKLIRPD